MVVVVLFQWPYKKGSQYKSERGEDKTHSTFRVEKWEGKGVSLVRRSGECHLKLKILSVENWRSRHSLRGSRACLFSNIVSTQASRRRERQALYFSLWVIFFNV